MIDLKPCPICGSSDKLCIYHRKKGIFKWRIECENHPFCRIYMKFGWTKESAIRRWNRFAENRTKWKWEEYDQ